MISLKSHLLDESILRNSDDILNASDYEVYRLRILEWIESADDRKPGYNKTAYQWIGHLVRSCGAGCIRINSNLEIETDETIRIEGVSDLGELPDYIKFGKVERLELNRCTVNPGYNMRGWPREIRNLEITNCRGFTPCVIKTSPIQKCDYLELTGNLGMTSISICQECNVLQYTGSGNDDTLIPIEFTKKTPLKFKVNDTINISLVKCLTTLRFVPSSVSELYISHSRFAKSVPDLESVGFPKTTKALTMYDCTFKGVKITEFDIRKLLGRRDKMNIEIE